MASQSTDEDRQAAFAAFKSMEFSVSAPYWRFKLL
jgi:hypothetical protein